MRGQHLSILTILLIGLSACSTAVYKQASGPNGFGYQEAALEEGRYRITFRARDAASAYDFALLRAAEVTLAKGYDWFRVTDAWSDDDERRRSGSRVTVGTGHGGWGHHSSRWGFGFGIPLGDSYRASTHSLDIVMGKGEKPSEGADGDKVYDAKSVKATIGPRVAPKK